MGSPKVHNHWMYQDFVLLLAWWWLVVAETCCQVFNSTSLIHVVLMTVINCYSNLLYIRNQSVPRCKHCPPRLLKPVSYWCIKQKPLSVLRSVQSLNAKRVPCRIFECWTWWYLKEQLDCKRLMWYIESTQTNWCTGNFIRCVELRYTAIS